MDETGNIHDSDETTNYDLEEIETISPEPDEEEVATQPRTYTYYRTGFWESRIVKIGAVFVALKLVDALYLVAMQKLKNK